MKSVELSRTILAFLGLIFIVCVAAPARAQDSVSINGSVSDQWFVPIPGAHVTLYSLERIMQTTSDASGRFGFDSVPVGQYEFEVVVPGFKRFTKRDVAVSNRMPSGSRDESIKLTAVMEIAQAGSPAEIIPATDIAPAGSCGPPNSVIYGPRQQGDGNALRGIAMDLYPKMGNNILD